MKWFLLLLLTPNILLAQIEYEEAFDELKLPFKSEGLIGAKGKKISWETRFLLEGDDPKIAQDKINGTGDYLDAEFVDDAKDAFALGKITSPVGDLLFVLYREYDPSGMSGYGGLDRYISMFLVKDGKLVDSEKIADWTNSFDESRTVRHCIVQEAGNQLEITSETIRIERDDENETKTVKGTTTYLLKEGGISSSK